MHFGLSSTYKQHLGSLKTELLENSWQDKDLWKCVLFFNIKKNKKKNTVVRTDVALNIHAVQEGTNK